jgi:uncharacterized phage protein (TIGR01671 family)
VREIIFRGKRIDTGEWVYGGFHKHQKYTPSPIIPKGEEPKEPECACLVIESGFSDWNMPKPILGHEVDPATVGQYTGICDRNKVKVFDGDILQDSEGTYVIHWLEGDARFIAIAADSYIFGDRDEAGEAWDLVWGYCEVIGNIHENPELLEQSPC